MFSEHFKETHVLFCFANLLNNALVSMCIGTINFTIPTVLAVCTNKNNVLGGGEGGGLGVSCGHIKAFVLPHSHVHQ